MSDPWMNVSRSDDGRYLLTRSRASRTAGA
jgi:hypothetical protein